MSSAVIVAVASTSDFFIMGLLSDLLKDIPLSSVLREKINGIEAENASLKTEVAILKDDLRKAQAENKRLTKEIERLTHTDDPRNERLETVLPLLNSFKNNLPQHELSTSDMQEYHLLLNAAENILDRSLGEFRIPHSAIKYREIPTSMSYDAFGNPSVDSLPVEHYIPSHVFQRKLDALMAFLAQKRV